MSSMLRRWTMLLQSIATKLHSLFLQCQKGPRYPFWDPTWQYIKEESATNLEFLVHAPHRCDADHSDAHRRCCALQLLSLPILQGHRLNRPPGFSASQSKIDDITRLAFHPLLSFFFLPCWFPVQNKKNWRVTRQCCHHWRRKMAIKRYAIPQWYFWICWLPTADLVLRSRPPFTAVLRGPGLKVPPGVLFGCFWAPGSECPKECFLALFSPKNAESTQKALFGALGATCPKTLKNHSGGRFPARPLSTPVNGGRDRKPSVAWFHRWKEARFLQWPQALTFSLGSTLPLILKALHLELEAHCNCKRKKTLQNCGRDVIRRTGTCHCKGTTMCESTSQLIRAKQHHMP